MPAKDPFEQLMPTIFQIGRERRAQRRKEKQAQQVSDVVKRLIHGDVKGEERAGLYAQAARFGVALPSQYAYDLADTKDLDWDQELKDAYNARLLTFTQATAAHSKANNNKTPSTEEVQELWNQSPELQQQFPGAGEITGATQLHTFFQFKEYAGTIAANRTFGMGQASELDVFDRKKKIIEDILGPEGPDFHMLRESPKKLGLLDLAGISYDDVLKYYGYDVSIVAKAKNAIYDRVKEGNYTLSVDLEGNVAMWRLGTLKDEGIAAILAKYFDKETGELKGSVVLDEVASLDKLALQNMGLDAAEIPEKIQPILTSLRKLGIMTKEELEEEIKLREQELADPYSGRPWANPTWTIELMREALEYFD